MSNSIWPFDSYPEPKPPIEDGSIGSIRCFVACPFEPRQRWDDLFSLIETVVRSVATPFGLEVKCYRADHIASAGVIHSEIWRELGTADFLIFDVSGQNGNVMLELGVASAWRRKEHVIILRDRNDEKHPPFDINPARRLEYEISFSGIQKFMGDLGTTIGKALASIPFDTPAPREVKLPFAATLTDGIDSPELYTEDITHRRILPNDCLEFGAPLNYRYSWMSLGDIRLAKVHVKVDMKMTMEVPNRDPYMGVMVRGQSYLGNCGHLAFVRKDGTVYLNEREDDVGKWHDEDLGKIADLNIKQFVHFDIRIDDNGLCIRVDGFSRRMALSDLPYVFAAGRVLLIAGHCRIGISNIEVTELQ